MCEQEKLQVAVDKLKADLAAAGKETAVARKEASAGQSCKRSLGQVWGLSWGGVVHAAAGV